MLTTVDAAAHRLQITILSTTPPHYATQQPKFGGSAPPS